jgi:ABC-type transport system involved in cytochrome c biogenesis permease component
MSILVNLLIKPMLNFLLDFQVILSALLSPGGLPLSFLLAAGLALLVGHVAEGAFHPILATPLREEVTALAFSGSMQC